MLNRFELYRRWRGGYWVKTPFMTATTFKYNPWKRASKWDFDFAKLFLLQVKKEDWTKQ